MVFKSSKQRKGFFGARKFTRSQLIPFIQKEKKPTFKIKKIKGKVFVIQTRVTKKGTRIITARPI